MAKHWNYHFNIELIDANGDVDGTIHDVVEDAESFGEAEQRMRAKINRYVITCSHNNIVAYDFISAMRVTRSNYASSSLLGL